MKNITGYNGEAFRKEKTNFYTQWIEFADRAVLPLRFRSRTTTLIPVT